MKKLSTLLLASTLTFSIQAQNIGINSTGAAPNNSAIMDLNTGNTFTGSNGKGLLTPNVALTSVTDAITVVSPATSLLVYNTASAGSGTAAVVPSFYYWDGTKWVKLQSSGSAAQDWNLLGNAATTPSVNFLGTTDNNDLVIRTNNTEKMRVTNFGSVGIGTNTPSSILEINSGAGYPSLTVGNMGFVAPFHGLSVQGTGTNGNYSLLGDATNLYINRPTGGNMCFRYNNTTNHMTIGTNGNVIIGPAVANASALLDVQSANKGFLMPRVALLSNTDAVTVASPATGLQVYNTNYTSTLSTGICYFDGAKWLNVSTYLPSGSGYFFQNSGFNVPNNGVTTNIPFGSIIAPASGVYQANIRTFCTTTGGTNTGNPNETAFYYTVFVNGAVAESVEYYCYRTAFIATSGTLRYTANAGDVITFAYICAAGYSLSFTNASFYSRNNVIIAKVQ